MTFARRFTERVATALLSLVATGMALGGVALAGLGATLRSTGSDLIEGMPVITAALMGLGVVLALPGGVAVIWVRGTGYSGARLAVSWGTPVVVLLLVAAALPVALATQLGPLTSYWRDIARLAAEYDVLKSANGPAALVFVPVMGVLLVPALEALAAGVVALGCGLLLVLMAARSAAVLKLSAIAALLVGGLTAASWVGVGVTERLVPSAESLIQTSADAGDRERGRALALLERHRAVVSGSVWALSWGWAVMILLAVGTRAVSGGEERDTAMDLDAAALRGLDDITREQALLDAADRLHRTTPPVRRF